MSSAGNISASAASAFFGGQQNVGAGKAPASGDRSQFGLHLIRSVNAQVNGTGKAAPETPFTGDLQSSLLQEIRQRLDTAPGEEPPRLSFAWNEEFGGFYLTIEQGGEAAEAGEGAGEESALFAPPAWALGELQQYLAKTDEPRLALVEDGEVIATNIDAEAEAAVAAGAGDGTDNEAAAPLVDFDIQTGAETGEFPSTAAGGIAGDDVDGAGAVAPESGKLSDAVAGAPVEPGADQETNISAAFADQSAEGEGDVEATLRETQRGTPLDKTGLANDGAILNGANSSDEPGSTKVATGAEALEDLAQEADPANNATASEGEQPDDFSSRPGKDLRQAGSAQASSQAVSSESQAQHRSQAALVRSDSAADKAADDRPISSLVDPHIADDAFEGQSRYARPFSENLSSDAENFEGKNKASGEALGSNAATGRALRSGVSAAALTFAAALKGEGAADEPEFSLSGLQQHGTAPLDISVSNSGTAAARAAAQIAQNPTQSAHLATQVAVEITRHASQGTNRFQIRLDPQELGRVDVRLKIHSDGSVQAHLTVERSETLDLFMRDQRGLERALDAAGLKVENSSLQFSLRDQGGSPGFAGHDPSGDGGAGGNGRNDRRAGNDEEIDPPDGADVRRAYVGVSTGAVDIHV
ncbi:hypothetical protein GR183_00090 [Stappia sp. GBMRC 2046]|uniref:Flagellar hook-length control protein-like C-terminal domain-containing protein n=1 Tax=Stappia sediminis TaxID=2692190 RepID=A0A7X3IZI7_9HYPH|nr:flagellar hook-length control protein FliK [Stappia sediminis]MXN63287.1 hypothetical protein [Stappia sediminis]